MMQRFSGKVCVVTGSTAGIGLATAERLLSEGAIVVISSRKQANVDTTLEALRKQHGEDRMSGLACHVGKVEDRDALAQHVVKKHGEFDVLVLNAATSPPQPTILETSETLFDKIMDVNVKAQLGLVQAMAPFMSGGGSICFVSSVGGYTPGAPHPAYGISKTAVFGLTRALATELSGQGIRVNCVAPGMVRTAFSKPLWENQDIADMVVKSTLLKRLGTAEEIAGCIAFLCSADAGFVTGEVLAAGGGPAPRL
eukprot:TRINITY_DN65270_c0_g1_i1.p1 TRINITY_DN65270_c0_g1~~TRINITY_DN65270_c0_g1_i1.p1  ORF type:complete len:254 (+),score=39.05 TRINITY_DN65270_c0_g1_i1:139-900(+)